MASPLDPNNLTTREELTIANMWEVAAEIRGTATITVPTQTYSDVYTGGIPFMVEYVHRYNSQWDALAGIGLQWFPSKEFDAVTGSAAGTLTPSSGTPKDKETAVRHRGLSAMARCSNARRPSCS